MRFLFVLLLSGCLDAAAVKACGEACKDHGGVKVVTTEECRCEVTR